MCKGAWAVGQEATRAEQYLLENEAANTGEGGEVCVDMKGGDARGREVQKILQELLAGKDRLPGAMHFSFTSDRDG